MRLEIKKYLYDIQYAIGLLKEFTGDKKFADYERDTMMRSAVERQFEIIGEAMSQLAKLDPALALPHQQVSTNHFFSQRSYPWLCRCG